MDFYVCVHPCKHWPDQGITISNPSKVPLYHFPISHSQFQNPFSEVTTILAYLNDILDVFLHYLTGALVLKKKLIIKYFIHSEKLKL